MYNEMKEYDDYLEGTEIVKFYEGEYSRYISDHMVVVFIKDNMRGIYVFGYNDLGRMLLYFQHGDTRYNVYDDFSDLEDYRDAVNEVAVENGFGK